MCKGVRRLSWGDIYSDLMSTDSDYSSWCLRRVECGICGTLKREIFCPDAGYFVNESDMWPFGGQWGQDIPHTGWPSHQRCPGRNWSAQPSPVLGHFRFLQATLKSFGSTGPGLAGVTSRPHGATEMGGKGMIIFSKPIIDHYMQKNKPPRNHIIEHTISFSEILNKASITNIKHSSPWGVRGMRRQFWSQ